MLLMLPKLSDVVFRVRSIVRVCGITAAVILAVRLVECARLQAPKLVSLYIVRCTLALGTVASLARFRRAVLTPTPPRTSRRGPRVVFYLPKFVINIGPRVAVTTTILELSQRAGDARAHAGSSAAFVWFTLALCSVYSNPYTASV